VWRAQIVLLSAEDLGTNAIMRETGPRQIPAPEFQGVEIAREGLTQATPP
jgi:hypothetical protein